MTKHLRTLKLAKLGKIKFLQQDDLIAKEGLNKFCEKSDEGTAIGETKPVS